MVTTGTKEWASSNVNCVDGCVHDCKYCYARKMAIRFKRKTAENWKVMLVRQHDVDHDYRRRDGRIMFPTSHDLIPTDPSFPACMTVLGKLLKSGNEVLVTTKPHLKAIEHICKNFEQFKGQIQFRFTITSMNDATLHHWEPGAPTFMERFQAAQHAFRLGFKTSISIEPILDTCLEDLLNLYGAVSRVSTESVWLGLMNYVRGGAALAPAEIYRAFKHRDGLVRFKDSIRNALEVA